MLAEIVAASNGGDVTVTWLLIGALQAVWGLLLTVGIVLRKRYESEITDLKKRNEKFEAQSERSLVALEQAVAIADKQNETINKVVDKQSVTLDQQSAVLATITNRLEEIKTTATRRARTP